MKHSFKILLVVVLAIFSAFSCKENGKNKAIFMPSVTGKAGDVLIVIEKPYWESEIGSELRTILSAEYQFLPQKEPSFTLYNTNHSSFKSYGSYSPHRNIIMLNIGDSFDTTRVVYQEDIWAAPQIVITISAPNKEAAYNAIMTDKERIVNALEQEERNRIITTSKKYQEIALRDVVLSDIGGAPYFPKGFSMKKHTPDFTWISYETTYVNEGLFIYTYPYNGEELTREYVTEKRDEFMKANVPGMREGSYMTTSSMIEPGFKWIKYKDRTFAELRGLWELEGDFMGGPFVSHIFLDKSGKNVIALEGFVYAPKFNKRNYLRHVESILYSFEWDN